MITKTKNEKLHTNKTAIIANPLFRTTTLKYFASMFVTMEGIKTATLRFKEEDHKKLLKAKGKMTWENFILNRCLNDE